MMIRIKQTGVGISPLKVRKVCDLIRKRYVDEALAILRFCEKREIAITLTKLIHSSLEIASESGIYDLDALVISALYVDGGPSLKRMRPRAKGRGFRIRKRTSYITLELMEG